MSESRILTVAAAQIRVSEDIDANYVAVFKAMHEAAARNVRVVLFPETALTGYGPAIGRGRKPAEWPAIERSLADVANSARELGIWVVLGSEVWLGDAWVNRLCAYSDSGELAAVYDKVHLMRADRLYYRPGEHHALFEIDNIQVGLQICYDARFPEGYRSLLHRGVEVILQGFYGAGGPTWKVPVLGAHLRSRAAENGCFIVAANVSGPLQILHSQIVDPLGLLLAEAKEDREDLIVADLHLARVAESEIRADYLTHHRAAGR